MEKVYLHIGSNQGDRASFLSEAILLINRHVSPIIETSSIYETGAWGMEDQPDFLNQVLVISTVISPVTLLKRLQKIEHTIGKNKNIKWGPRNIDIDILFYGKRIINTEFLKVPHPFLQERNFVLAPMVEIAAELLHPVLKKTILALEQSCKDQGFARKINNNTIIE